MKVLFLDFDGVMNSAKWMIAQSETIKKQSGLTWRHACELDPTAVRRVLRIINTTGAAVVVSSSWRIIHTPEEINEIFIEAGFPEMNQHIIGRTPYDLTKGKIRGLEIQEWINWYQTKNGKLENFVILDDDNDMLPVQKESHFVQTSWEHGVQEEHVEKAIKILGESHVPI